MSEGGGRFRASSILVVIAAMGCFLMCGGLSAIAFGLAGGPALIDPPADPARADQIAAAGVEMMFFAGCFLLGFGGLILLIGLSAHAAKERHRPRGTAAHDPVAWIAYALGHGAATWTGEVAGRRVHARSYHRRYAPSGQQLSVRLDVPTRVAWTRRTGVGAMIDAAAGVQSTPGDPYGYPGMDISAPEPEWAQRLIARPDVRDAVHTLADGQGTFVLTLRPGRLLFALPQGTGVGIDPPRAERWTQALRTIAAAAEQNGPPSHPLDRNALERTADTLEG